MTKLYQNFTAFILTKVVKKIDSTLKIFFKQSIRKIAIKNDVVKVTYFNSGAKLRLFNLDLHIGVIRDIKQEIMTHTNVELISWSISNHNGIVRGFTDVPDPVKFVNNKNWTNLNVDLRKKFIEEYGKFLKNFDGYVVTHTPSFVDLYGCFEKPILLINSTRYEAPYSAHPESWRNLDKSLMDLSKNGQLTAASNNRGDQAYMLEKAGIFTDVVPSYCDYLELERHPKSREIFVYSRSNVLQNIIASKSKLAVTTTYESHIAYQRIASAHAVVIFPQNISTMMLFELATIGVPVLVPTQKFMTQLIEEGYPVLSELSFFQIYGLDVSALDASDLNNYKSPDFYTNWLNYADFYDEQIMPNIFVFNSIRELDEICLHLKLDQSLVDLRNHVIGSSRKKFN